jgi:hypothetical protein
MRRNRETTPNVSRNNKYNKVQNPVSYSTNCVVSQPKGSTLLIPKPTTELDPETLPYISHIYNLSPKDPSLCYSSISSSVFQIKVPDKFFTKNVLIPNFPLKKNGTYQILIHATDGNISKYLTINVTEKINVKQINILKTNTRALLNVIMKSGANETQKNSGTFKLACQYTALPQEIIKYSQQIL